MNDENQIFDGVPGEPASMESEGSYTENAGFTVPYESEGEATETVPETTEFYIPDVTEGWEQTVPITEPEETLEETIAETVEFIDYTPIIAESTSILSSMILAGALMIVGCLLGIRLWR